MIRQALNILRLSMIDLWDNLYVLTLANLLWALSLAPGFGIYGLVGGYFGLGLGLLLIALISGPVTIGLYGLTLDVNRRERLDYGEIFRSIRRYYRRGIVLGILNILFLALTVINIGFYVNIIPLLILWGYIVFTWFAGQLYLWPLAIRMEQFNLRTLLVNTLLCTFKYPALSLTLGFIMAIVFGISYFLLFLPVMVFVLVYHTMLSNKALLLILERESAQVLKLREQGIEVESSLGDIQVPEPKPVVAPEPIFTNQNPPPGVKRRGSR